MVEQHLLSFVLYRIFFNKTIAGNKQYFLMGRICIVKVCNLAFNGFSKAHGKISIGWNVMAVPSCSLDTGSPWIVLHFAFLHFELLSSEYGIWWLPELIASVQCLISTHYINTWLVCRSAYLPQEIRDCEVRKKTSAYSTCSIKILNLITLMLHLISTVFFLVLVQDELGKHCNVDYSLGSRETIFFLFYSKIGILFKKEAAVGFWSHQ